MRKILAAALLACALLCAVPASAALDENAIRAFYARLDEAAARKDVAGVIAPISPTAEITVIVNNQVLRLNKAQYAKMVTDGLQAAENYRYKRVNTRIDMIGPAKAKVTATVNESITVNGKTAHTRTDEESTVERINGALVITSLTGSMTSQ